MDKVLVIGSGGREHALGWKLAQSKDVFEVIFAPGNGGTGSIGKNFSVNPNDFESIERLVLEEEINLTVVGPELPLVNGIVDYFHNHGLVNEGHHIFGPSREAAKLEGSKSWAKTFMLENGIPTAEARTFCDAEDAKTHLRRHYNSRPVVVKADGLAEGKGVKVCRDHEEGIAAIDQMMIDKRFGKAGDTVLIEEFLEGEELSVLGLSDGKTVRMMLPAQDHKRALDYDEGENTGGMGAYAPVPFVTGGLLSRIYKEIMVPTIDGMAERGTPYVGCLYAGLMMTKDGPKVIEYNCRFGDPETQPLMMILDDDLHGLMMACAQGTLGEIKGIKFKDGYSCCVVMASKGYPGRYEKGHVIEGLERLEIDTLERSDLVVFHAGTKFDEGRIKTNGGRVLGITTLGHTLGTATGKAYGGINCISWGNPDGSDIHFRTDIGKKGLR
ncbi:MAG: phosphoribosylamine--glycine ligase [Nanoarchaeota archaeon]|nr:phosphoribosylamine--glycine ligase [Nanoarchaeota archaeon]